MPLGFGLLDEVALCVGDLDGFAPPAGAGSAVAAGVARAVDWPTYSGFRRYHSDCHVCHGPDGEGSSYAPALSQSLKSISYSDFLGAVASGKRNVNTAQENVMPAFGTNPNVMCYVEDIYVYLRARSDGAIGPVRPAKHDDKPKAYAEAEDTCMTK